MKRPAFVLVVFLIITCFSSSLYSQPIEKSTVNPETSTTYDQGGPSRVFSSQDVLSFSSRIVHLPNPYIMPVPVGRDDRAMSREIGRTAVYLSDPRTKIAPSHLGHPGYENVAFLYDKAVDAMILKAAGYDREAEAVLDYFAERLRIPMEEIRKNADANGVYGILKLYPSIDDPRAVGLVNAFNMRSIEREGEARLEYWATPGPLAFMVLAFLYVDRQKFLPEALMLGSTLLAMQREDGAITDGDRATQDVNTEPHMDSYSVFLALYEVTGDPVWQRAADRAWDWFSKNVLRPDGAIIFQGIHGGSPSEIFATDAYSWTMAGRGGERIPLEMLERLTDRMLRQGLSRVTLELPDGKSRTVTLVDFADIKDMRVIADRGGFHPMGSIEWIGGVILCLQKNAVRFWETGDAVNREKARFYKGLAEYFMAEAMKSFYHVEGVDGKLSFYATGQWVATGHGWHTPYFYVKDPNGNPVLKGGSTVGAWPVLPLTRNNPFKLGDNYGSVYDAIPIGDDTALKIDAYITSIVRERSFTEIVPTEMAEGADGVSELWQMNQRMFQSFVAGDYYAAILWAQKVVGNEDWGRRAKEEQKRKAREMGGLVDYPWGSSPDQAKNERRAVLRYPLLNEVGTAMWGLAVSNYKLGNIPEAKAWIRSIIEAVPYHQIFAPSGPGYWNALVSWETNPGGSYLDSEMGILYREVLKEMGLTSALPKSFPAKP